ncbi:MAG: caspase family protein [Pyrinomonadaceae bacterium]
MDIFAAQRIQIFASLSMVFAMLVCFCFESPAQDNRQLVQDAKNDKTKRTALVIGNSDYLTARKLSNPANDAADMARTLADVGFEVIFGNNLSMKEMTEKVREFGDALKINGGVGLFYYAGHGVQVGGRNYLVPVEANIPREDEIDFNAFNVDLVFRKMASANNGLNIVVLDACRNNPFARSWSRGDDEGGLAQISAPTGTFIAYATSPDKTASDGTGRNGLYTAELLKILRQPNLKIEEAFKQVTLAVDRASSGRQIPWTSSSLRGEFYFKLDGKDVKGTFSATVTPTDPGASDLTNSSTSGAATSELDAWNKIKSSSEPQDFAKFLNAYPNGIFVDAAKNKLIELTGGAPASNRTANPMDFYQSLITGATGGGNVSVYYRDGQSRVRMNIAAKKQDYTGGAGIMGIGGGFKAVDTLNNARAPLRVRPSPEFEFEAPSNMNASDIAFVVRLKSKSDKREIQSMQRTFSGYKQEDIVPVVYEKTESAGTKTTYKIKFAGALAPGEYAVVFKLSFADTGLDTGANLPGTFFDFGVDK